MTYTVRQLCEELGVEERTVLAWIASGELRAYSVARTADAKRKSWRVSPTALNAFREARSAVPAPRPRRRRKSSSSSIDFY